MIWQLAPYAAIHGLTAAITFAVAWAMWRRRKTPGAVTLAALMLAVGQWALAAALEVAAVNSTDKVLWSQIEYLGAQATAPLFVIFATQFTAYEQRLTRRLACALFALPAATVLMAATNEWHGLLWPGFTPVDVDGIHYLIYGHGPWFWIAISYLYGLALVGIFILLRAVSRFPHLFQRQAVAVIVASVVAVVGSTTYVLELIPTPYLDTSPTAFALAGLILGWSLYRHGLLSLVPIARDMLFEQMPDGVVILDPQNRIVDANRGAQRMVGTADSQWGGQLATSVFNNWPAMLQQLQAGEGQTEVRPEGDESTYLETRLSPIKNRYGRIIGRLVLMRDITARRRAEIALHEHEEQLWARLMEIQSLHEQLREQAIRDVLTGLFNRRYLEETLVREIHRAATEARPLSVLIWDLDTFKRINDTLGHSVGDAVLRAVGHTLGSQTRKQDVVCRYGGDEFVVVLLGTGADAARRRADTMRMSIMSMVIPHEGMTLKVTASCGVATFPAHGATADGLLQAADQALYAAKSAGGNRVVVWHAQP